MKKGFTLLEVLLALAMLALVISLIQGVYSGTARSRTRSREATRETHAAAFLLHRLADELAMAYVDSERPEATGLVLVTDTEDLSSIAFTTRVPPVSGFSSGGTAEVGYFLETGEDGSVSLMRRESADLDGDLETGGDPYTLLSGPLRFTVECYDGEQWISDWDSTETGELPPLPLAARISLAWQPAADQDQDQGERLYRTSTPIYASGERP